MKPKLALLVPIFFLLGLTASAQKVTTRGKEFYVSFFGNFGSNPDTTIVFMTSSVNTNGNVINPNTGFNKAFTITAGQVTQVPVPLAQAYNNVSGVVKNLGLQIIAADTISAYALCSEIYSSDATCVLQKDALGTDYMIASYTGTKSSVLIEATEDGTVVKITPSTNTLNGNAANVPFNINLNKGQTYLTASGGDLSGSFVSVTNGCKPIAVFSGNQLSYVPTGYSYGDIVYEQMFPINNWGKQFITATLRGRNVYRARVYAGYNGTTINIDGSPVATINAGGFYEFQSANQPKYITTNNPVQVMIFAASINYDNAYGPSNYGDPTMITVPPLEQKLKESIFLSPVTIGTVSLHKVSIVCKTADAANTILDGVNIGSSFAAVAGNPLYSHVALDVAAGQHKVQNANGFIAYAYGFGYEQGYGYCTGSSVENINTYFTCNNVASIGNPTVDVCPGADSFNIITSGVNAGYSWDFGDGTNAVATDGSILKLTHSYATPGTYVVTLTTTSQLSALCTPPIISQITVHVASSLVPSVALISSPSSPFCRGTKVNFIATPTNGGTSPIYQWKKNGVNVGTNSPTYTDSTLADNDIISCVLASSLTCATVSSVNAVLTVHTNSQVVASVNISTPVNTVCSGNPVTFTAVPIAGSLSPMYQWKVNGANVGANSTTYTYTPKNGDVVTCSLTIANGCAAVNNGISNAITMTVTPQVGSSVASVNIATPKNPICANSPTIFTATPTSGGTTPMYQWKVNGTNVGTNSPTYTNATLQNNDTVYCMMTSNASCIITPIVTSNKIVVQVNPILIPTVSIAVTKNNICQGDQATFTASITNGGSLPSYQWNLNGTNVGGNATTYTNSNLANGDSVSCTMVSNAACVLNPALSTPIIMTVNPIIHPTIAIAASKNPICQTDNVIFSTTITAGGNAPTYYWSVNGSAVNGGSSYASSTFANGDKVGCRMVSSLICATDGLSPVITMQVNPLPTVVFNPNEVVILYGTTYKLTSTVTGNISAYIWTPPTGLDNAAIANPTTSTLDNQTYNLKVTTPDNCTANSNMKIIVFRDLVMPNAFTPNGDGNNDVFGIPSIYQSLKINYLTIYDRWGKKFFETSDINKKWDGSINGALQPAGVYIWMIEYENPITKQTKVLSGSVILIR